MKSYVNGVGYYELLNKKTMKLHSLNLLLTKIKMCTDGMFGEWCSIETIVHRSRKQKVTEIKNFHLTLDLSFEIVFCELKSE